MLYFDRIDVSEGVDVNKTDDSRVCIICYYWYFLEISFRFQLEVCNECHDLMQKAMRFDDVAITSVKGNDCRIYCWYNSKDEAIILF